MANNEERYLLQALRFEGDLRASLHRYTHDSSDIENLLQETYARLLVAGAADEPEVSSIRAFAHAMSRDVACDWRRRKHLAPIDLVGDGETLDAQDDGGQVERTANSEQELARLVKAMQRLPERCRQVFTLRKVYGYSQKDIATRLSISDHSVEQYLTQAARDCARAMFDQPATEHRASIFDRFRKPRRAHDQGD
jgi:RNA polymerase sigma factor (sigma-70 family)